MSLSSWVRGAAGGASKMAGNVFRPVARTARNIFRPVGSVFKTATDTAVSAVKSTGRAITNLFGGAEKLVSGVSKGAGRVGSMAGWVLPAILVPVVGLALYVGYQWVAPPGRGRGRLSL